MITIQLPKIGQNHTDFTDQALFLSFFFVLIVVRLESKLNPAVGSLQKGKGKEGKKNFRTNGGDGKEKKKRYGIGKKEKNIASGCFRRGWLLRASTDSIFIYSRLFMAC